MKKIFLFLLFACFVLTAIAQKDTQIAAPYKRFPEFPPARLLLPDSAIFTKHDLDKKKAVMLMLFNPSCELCRHETEDIIHNIEQFKNIQIIMVTTKPYDSMMLFREQFQLYKHRNITLGQDTRFLLPGFFMLNNFPFLAFYNRKKQLISVFEGALPIPAILEVFRSEESK